MVQYYSLILNSTKILPKAKADSLLKILAQISRKNPDPKHLLDGLHPPSQWLHSLYEGSAPQQPKHQNLPQNIEEITLPEQALEVP